MYRQLERQKKLIKSSVVFVTYSHYALFYMLVII